MGAKVGAGVEVGACVAFVGVCVAFAVVGACVAFVGVCVAFAVGACVAFVEPFVVAFEVVVALFPALHCTTKATNSKPRKNFMTR